MHSINSQIADLACPLHLSSESSMESSFTEVSIWERGTYQPQLGMPKTILPLAWEQRILPTMPNDIHETWQQRGHWRAAHAFLSVTSRNGRKEWLVYEPNTTKSESTSKCAFCSIPFTHGKLCKEKPTGKSNTPRPKIISPLKTRPWLKSKCSVVSGRRWGFTSKGLQNHFVSSIRGH